MSQNYAMADVASKPITYRRALASGRIVLGQRAYDAVAQGRLAKGDALSMAQIAGIMAAKQTPTLIPLCHPISLNRVLIEPVLQAQQHAVDILCLAEIGERTGVEMEALTGVQIALLTIWDLAKPIEPALRIEAVKLLYKEGGKSGLWQHPDGVPEHALKYLEKQREST